MDADKGFARIEPAKPMTVILNELEPMLETAAEIIYNAAENWKKLNPNTYCAGFGLQVWRRKFDFTLERPSPVAFRISTRSPSTFSSCAENGAGVAEVLEQAAGSRDLRAEEVFDAICGAINRKWQEWKLEVFFDGFVEVSLRTQKSLDVAYEYKKRDEKSSLENLKKVFRQVVLEALADRR